jgi:hypothetical protein
VLLGFGAPKVGFVGPCLGSIVVSGFRFLCAVLVTCSHVKVKHDPWLSPKYQLACLQRRRLYHVKTNDVDDQGADWTHDQLGDFGTSQQALHDSIVLCCQESCCTVLQREFWTLLWQAQALLLILRLGQLSSTTATLWSAHTSEAPAVAYHRVCATQKGSAFGYTHKASLPQSPCFLHYFQPPCHVSPAQKRFQSWFSVLSARG